MLIIVHRVNKISELENIPKNYGVEIDVRCMNKDLILNHEPHQSGDKLEDYLNKFNHKFIIFNIKEAGIEKEVIELAKKHNIKEYFLLDVEYPFIYKASREMKFKKIAIRYSEAEPIEFALAHKGMADWVWIDTNSQLPLDKNIVEKLKGFKTCLVCPERWGRPEDIDKYLLLMKKINFKPDAIMTALKYSKKYEGY